ncbi:hypothetical protein [Natronogracilivirga saccharolytica]|uniref:Uncharacterized protein n=1 Tax=Natronogracilivirga saccharolytica TaxID=2812953 RepID=A0A8J7RIL1_9BACT|nr:hypothetical protein [Natronogracilivirga saccharolytica]MBP3191932.1 hypothetical protein [Natronogracilivirga saccharolytica]
MNVSSLINSFQAQDTSRTTSLRQAAATAGPAKLTDEESRMIHREFSGTEEITFYNGSGESKQQMVAGRGQHLDTII